MRRVVSTSFFLAAFLLPTLGLALDNQHPAMLAQTDEAHPAQRTETKPFDPHAAHAPPPTGPWFDLSGLPPPRRGVSGGIAVEKSSQMPVKRAVRPNRQLDCWRYAPLRAASVRRRWSWSSSKPETGTFVVNHPDLLRTRQCI